eukprot:12200386-Karenia_brevis.AAC.1
MSSTLCCMRDIFASEEFSSVHDYAVTPQCAVPHEHVIIHTAALHPCAGDAALDGHLQLGSCL